jgi:hypothetical protein
MTTGETRLQMAIRHLAQQEAAVEKQNRTLERLRKANLPTVLAEQILDTMEQALEFTRDELRRPY